ncbi:MAG: GTP-binding protein, partial [Burkholderiales bacterium]|nr:GTP-binding protein [Burkholderiales bacterium]
MGAPRETPLGVTVIGGYLGAGKTTLVNHLLRHAGGRRLAVLVNDFGDLPIDADLIEADTGGVLSLAGGCICCSFGNDLMAALATLPARRPPPEHVLIEASGVALPGTVAASLALLADVALDAVVVLADAQGVRARAADRYLADTIERQLRAADIVVLNKVDLVDPAERAALRDWLGAAAPGARVLDAVRAAL